MEEQRQAAQILAILNHVAFPTTLRSVSNLYTTRLPQDCVTNVSFALALATAKKSREALSVFERGPSPRICDANLDGNPDGDELRTSCREFLKFQRAKFLRRFFLIMQGPNQRNHRFGLYYCSSVERSHQAVP